MSCSNALLRSELVAMAENDLSVRAELIADGSLTSQGYHPRMEAVHKRNASRLAFIIDRYGWPGISLVGEDGARAAWLIAQHAIGNPPFMRRYRLLLTQAASENEAPRWQLATMEDRIRMYEGRSQRYGTQFQPDKNGAFVPPPLSDGTWQGPVEHTRAYTTATQIERDGVANYDQRARIYLDPTQLHELEVGDYLQIDGRPEQEGGAVVQVKEIGSDAIGDYLSVFPWPARWDEPDWNLLEGSSSWHVEAIIGGVLIRGSNTTGSRLQGPAASYCGHALQVAALYGCHATGLVGEVVGSALTIGDTDAATWGVSVRCLHPEVDGVAVLVNSRNVKRVCVISPVIDLDPGTPGGNGFRLVPRRNDGSLNDTSWPVEQLP